MTARDDVLDSIFHGCALRAYLEIAAESHSWPPPAEETRRRAYDLYEEALREKNRQVDRREPVPAGAESGSEAA